MRTWLAFLILLAACNKSANGPGSIILPKNNSIVGTWELAQEVGGFVGILNYPAGNGTTIEFTSAGSFKQASVGSSTVLTGSYQVTILGSPNKKNLLVRKYDGSPDPIQDSVSVSNNQLSISTPPACCDIPYLTVYRRKF
ncbi:MAG: hypothetical protein JST75_18735 [Bacteroidetes bacterium]|nr:hypothetical protein [Bacteroidota bacterium]